VAERIAPYRGIGGMIHLIESVLNGVVLFVGPLMLVGAIASGLAMLQRWHDTYLGHHHAPEMPKRPMGPALQRF
jgi:hypothetical protein